MPDNNGVQYTNPPQSRNEAILEATINGTPYTDPPQSRIEDLLLQLKAKIEGGGPIPPVPTKTPIGIKVHKTVSRYTVGSTINTNDITCTVKYLDGTTGTVTPTIDATSASSASVGVTYIDVTYEEFSAKVPITIYDSQVVDDNILQLEDTEPTYSNGVTWYIKDNVMHLDGTPILHEGKNNEVKVTNTPAFVWGTVPDSWAAETIEGIVSGNTYSCELFVLSGTSTDSGSGVFSIRDSSKTSIISRTKNPATIAANGAYAQCYWAQTPVFDNYAVAFKVVNGSTKPTAWTFTPEGADPGVNVYGGNYDPTMSRVVKCTQLGRVGTYSVMQGIAYEDGHYYCGVSNTSGAAAMDYVLAKIDPSDYSIISVSSSEHPLGHCNAVAYCSEDQTFHCVALDAIGTVYRVAKDLSYVDSYVIDLSATYPAYEGIGAIAYNAAKEKFVVLLRGSNKKFAVLNKNKELEKIYDVEALGGTYGGILTDDNYVYLSIHYSDKQKIAKYNWDFELVETYEDYGTMGSNEAETLTWKGTDLIWNTAQRYIYKAELK